MDSWNGISFLQLTRQTVPSVNVSQMPLGVLAVVLFGAPCGYKANGQKIGFRSISWSRNWCQLFSPVPCGVPDGQAACPVSY